MEFYVIMETLTNELRTIRFHTIETDLSEKWSQLLVKQINDNVAILDPNRVYCLNSNWSKHIIKEQLNDCIVKLNMSDYLTIEHNPDVELTRDITNKLHDQTLIRQGYAQVPRSVREDLSQMNILIHRYESFGGIPRIVVTFDRYDKVPLEDEHFRSFKLDVGPSDVTLDYCHAGKSIWEVFQDQDESLQILPQTKYNSSFTINFGIIHYDIMQTQFENWFEERKHKLPNRLDPKCAIGRAPVAKLIGDPMEIKEQIFGVHNIVEVGYV